MAQLRPLVAPPGSCLQAISGSRCLLQQGGADKLGLESYYYWSSTEYNYDHAWYFYYENGTWEIGFTYTFDLLVRSCLAF